MGTIKHVPGIPEISYPSIFTVKNTFIDMETWRPSSLDGFYEERQINSCPASGIDLPVSSDEYEADETMRLTTIKKCAAAEVAMAATEAVQVECVIGTSDY